MRVGLIIYGSLASVSGGYLYDRQAVQFLRAGGDEVEVISLPWRTYAQHLLDNWSGPLRDLLQHGGYDVVVQDELNHPSLFRLNDALRPRPAPVVSIVHHLRSSEARPVWQNVLYRSVEGRYLNSVDAFIFNSRTTAETVGALLRQPRPSLVAPPGRDHLTPGTPPPAASEPPKTGPLRLLFVGNLIRRKGLHTLLEAVSQLPPGGWTLDVVGDETVDTTYAREIDDRIARFPPGAPIRRHGRVEDATLAELYAATDALVVPSDYEGYGIVYAEAMGFGLPVIATSRGAAAEIVEDGISGYLVPPDHPAALARRLTAWQADRALLATMSRQARDRYEHLPTWAETGAAIRDFLLAQVARHNEGS